MKLKCSVNDKQALRIPQVWSDSTNATNTFKPRILFAMLLLSPQHWTTGGEEKLCPMGESKLQQQKFQNLLASSESLPQTHKNTKSVVTATKAQQM